MSSIAKTIFHIHALTPIKEVWITLFFAVWLAAVLFLCCYRSFGPPMYFLRLYLALWLFDACKYQAWWNLGFQAIMDSAVLLAALEAVYLSVWLAPSMFERAYARARMLATDLILVSALVFAVPKAYAGMSSSIYFTHLYTLAASCGVLIGSILHNWSEKNKTSGHFLMHSYLLLLWLGVQLATSGVVGHWFLAGILRLLGQGFCILAWLRIEHLYFKKSRLVAVGS